MKLHTAVAKVLAGNGVRTMFGLGGEADLRIVSSFREGGGEYFGSEHLAAAMSMGFGYAERSGRLGVVKVPYGPVLTSTLPGLTEAVRAQVPLLLITGSARDRRNFAWRDVVVLTGTGFDEARTPESTPVDLSVAIRQALSERQPVVFHLPAGFSDRDIDYRPNSSVTGEEAESPVWAAPSDPSGLPELPDALDVETALRRLDELLPEERTVVGDDGGRVAMELMRHVRVSDPRAYVIPLRFGSSGMGMGTAVGAAVARRGEPVIVVSSDRSFVSGGVAEFTTAVRAGLDIIVVVCNDGGPATEELPSLPIFDWPDLAAVAEALGGTGITVRTPADLEAAAKVMTRRTGPLLIDLHLPLRKV